VDNIPEVSIGIPDNRLASRGCVQRWYPSKELWEEVEQEYMYHWPGTRVITLMPLYPLTPDESVIDEWTCSGTDAQYIQSAGLGNDSPTLILQQNPIATACTVESNFTPEDNQPFYVDFYLHAVYDDAWYADLTFCERYGLRILYNGVLQLFRNVAIGEETPEWKYAGECPTHDTTFNKHIRIAVYPTAQGSIIIHPVGFDPIEYIDPQPVISETIVYSSDEEPTETTYTIRTACPASPIKLVVTGGAFYFSYRYMEFSTEGSFKYPEYAIPYDSYEGEFEFEGSVGVARSGHDFDVEIVPVDETGTIITSPPEEGFSSFYPRVTFSEGDGLCTPELYWVEMRIDPTTQVFTPAPPFPLLLSGCDTGLLDVVVDAAMDGERTAEIDLCNIDGAAAALLDVLHLRTRVAVDEIPRWEGYLIRRQDTESQDGMLRITMTGSDPLLRLQVPLTDAYIGDGRVHTDYVEDLFKYCGLAPTDYVIVPDPDNMVLPQAMGDNDPYFQARDGHFAREMIEYICKVFSGWDLYPDQAGVLYYAPPGTPGIGGVTLYGSECQSRQDGGITYYSLEASRDAEQFFNQIVVIGESPRETPIIASWQHVESIIDPTDVDFLGYVRLLVVVDSTLCTAELVETALEMIVEQHGYPHEIAEVECDWHPTLELRDSVTIDGRGEWVTPEGAAEGVWAPYVWQIKQIRRSWSNGARLRLGLERYRDAIIPEEDEE
jgi:hypothetical protein